MGEGEEAEPEAAVNWMALDGMVMDFCKAEGVVTLGGEEDVLDAGAAARATIAQVRDLIERGCIVEALSFIRKHAEFLLEDQRILFWLYKQHFIEMLRDGGLAARWQAIECSRVKLGPCALNAYPEAYEEFKRILLVLIYDKEHQDSPVAEEWSVFRRSQLAATVASTLRARWQVHDPPLALTLRYLISIHNALGTSSIGDVPSGLILEARDPAPALPDSSAAEVPSLNEVDVQALAQAAELSRQDAVQSLKFTSGDVMAALKNELSRIRTNTNILDKLVWEYCVYRGLVVCEDPTSHPNTEGQRDVEMEDVNSGDCCTSSSGKDAVTEKRRYRWRGRGKLESACPMELGDNPEKSFERYKRAIRIRELVVERRISDAIHELKCVEPDFLEKHPQLLFQLKQIEFCSNVESGNQARALEVARDDLGPLAAKYPEFLRPMKETVFNLACGPDAASVSSVALIASLQLAVSASLGITEPQLMKIMKACLSAHTEWFKVQMCSDPFADLLNIKTLKEAGAPVSKQPGSKAEKNNEGDAVPFAEQSILTVMEFLAVSRGDAIHLLGQCGGNAEEVVHQYLPPFEL